MADESNTTRMNEAMKPVVRFSFYALPRGKFKHFDINPTANIILLLVAVK